MLKFTEFFTDWFQTRIIEMGYQAQMMILINLANVLTSILANSHGKTGGKFDDRLLFELSSSTLST